MSMANGRKKAMAKDKNVGNTVPDFIKYKMVNLKKYIEKIDSITNSQWPPL